MKDCTVEGQMYVKRYARRSRGVLSGANAAPYACSVRRKPAREVDWARLQPLGRPAAGAGAGVERGSVVAISITMEGPAGLEG